MKNVTIRDVAAYANVSVSTVSRALTGSADISPDTRERVLSACIELNYNFVRRNGAQSSRKNTLGLILPSLDNPFMSELAHNIDRQARKLNYTTLLCCSYGEQALEKSLMEHMVDIQADGVLLLPINADSCAPLGSLLARMPTVFVDEDLKETSESYVAVDNFKGAYLGVEYLYGLGHRDILYFGCRRTSTTHQLRADGYAAACRDYGLKPQYMNNTFPSSSIKYGYQLAKQLFAEERSHTAIFAATDTNAIGTIKAAAEHGISIPRQLSLLGFDNIHACELPGINLTTIEQPLKILASVSLSVLLDKINGGTNGYTHRILMPTLIERGSCGAPLAL